mmetsp:Transcript_84423/g.103462  ORF Transcript_84423/g.103462 Transcript_84423/m.103462 type:complete len:126 (+) Transcript_84423:384-761(+)
MHVKHVYDNGKMIDPKVLDIKSEDIIASFKRAINNVSSASLGSGFIVKSAAPHLIGNAFKNLVGVTFETSFTFKQAEEMKNAASAATAAPAAAAAGDAPAAKKEEEEDEEVDMGAGGLFGEEDEY